MKIDHSFIKCLDTNKKDAAITTAITTLAHSLNMGPVAEGVENKKQLEFLRTKGCQQIQGCLISKPLPVELVAQLLNDKSRVVEAEPA